MLVTVRSLVPVADLCLWVQGALTHLNILKVCLDFSKVLSRISAQSSPGQLASLNTEMLWRDKTSVTSSISVHCLPPWTSGDHVSLSAPKCFKSLNSFIYNWIRFRVKLRGVRKNSEQFLDIYCSLTGPQRPEQPPTVQQNTWNTWLHLLLDPHQNIKILISKGASQQRNGFLSFYLLWIKKGNWHLKVN